MAVNMTKDLPVTTRLFVLPCKIQRKRLDDMKSSMLKKAIPFSNIMDHTVTHVVTEFDNLDQVDKQMNKDGLHLPEGACVVSTKWLVQCLKASKIVPVIDAHILKKPERISVDAAESKLCPPVTEWACQRGAKLDHFNKKFVDALETLQLHAEFRSATQDYSRALAFRRASCVLKSLPFELRELKQLAGLKDIGDHVGRVITEILDHGSSTEVEEIINSGWFQRMKTFTQMFGVGPATAKGWIARGWTTVEDVRRAGCPSNDWRMIWGLAFYEDLATPVSRQEADNFVSIVMNQVEELLPGSVATLTGGFRRGKHSGHDVDILISHPVEGQEVGLLPKLLSALVKRDLVLVGHREKNSYRPDILYQDLPHGIKKGQLDHFEKWLGICKFPKTFQKPLAAEVKAAQTLRERSDSIEIKGVSTGLGEDLLAATKAADVSVASSPSSSNGKRDHSQLESHLDDSFDEMYEPQCKISKLGKTENHPVIVARSRRTWLARRVDLIVCPWSQYFYALVGWTGSKHFNRDARLFAARVLNMRLTSHGLFDMKQNELLPASSEEEVFKHLQLPYREPTDRNC